MAEAAGLALAVLPLLISAAEHYEDCLRPLRRFLHFASEVDRFQRKLQIQKTIFRNQCRILLEGVVDHDVAVRMLLDGEHPCWRDPDVEECISNQLEASKDACLSIIDDIRFVLENLENWSLNLSETIQEDGKVNSERFQGFSVRAHEMYSRRNSAQSLGELSSRPNCG